jgi:hypothetical protein
MAKKLYYALFIVAPILVALLAYGLSYLAMGHTQTTVFNETWRRFPSQRLAWVFAPAARLESLASGKTVRAAYCLSAREYRAIGSKFATTGF